MRDNKAKMTFQTDYNVTGHGFRLEWKSINTSQCGENGSNVIEAKRSGVLQSVNYPMSYLNNLNCRTVVTMADISRVWLEFDEFDLSVQLLNCSDDLIIFLDPGKDTSYSQRVCSWNNSDISNLRFLSVNNKVEFVFTTDDFYNGNGYSVSYKAGETSFICIFSLSKSNAWRLALYVQYFEI